MNVRVFKLSDGTSWVARLHDEGELSRQGSGWQAILFEAAPAGATPRLVYRPTGWLDGASQAELVDALDEGVAVRVRWGG
jgi:hypothetical protein